MNLTRRFVLQSSGTVAAYAALTPLRAMGAARRGKTLVVLFLRGGADGLNLVVPHGDPAYYEARGDFAIAKNDAIDLDGFFGLHPEAATLAPLFEAGTARALHAVGHARNTRSHFEEQDVWETGVVENTIASDGWLNRHLATTDGDGILRAVSIGDALPRILRGRKQAIAIRGLDETAAPEEGLDALERAYAAEGDELLARTGRETLAAIRELRKITAEPYAPAAPYPETDLARRLREVARLIKAGAGVEVAEIDFGGWDTHQDQSGAVAELVRELSGALAAFCEDLGDRLADVLVLTLSDFGRTVKPNGTRGTDHGWGNCMMALGGAVAGASKKVLGEWPGLAPDRLYEERDLRHTTDFRDVLAEVVRGHLGNLNLDEVLPGHEIKPVGLLG